jgi:hypothetical protein
MTLATILHRVCERGWIQDFVEPYARTLINLDYVTFIDQRPRLRRGLCPGCAKLFKNQTFGQYCENIPTVNEQPIP